jgi:hypothetical protein
MKTNREKNQEFDTKQSTRVRPKGPIYNWKPLEDVIRSWIAKSK